MNRSTFWMIKYMNGSVFSKARYMNGIGFEMLARTPVPKLPLSYPHEGEKLLKLVTLGSLINNRPKKKSGFDGIRPWAARVKIQCSNH